MDLSQAVEQFRAIKKEIGAEALVSAQINVDMTWRDDRPVFASVYPDGVCGNTPYFYVFANDWDELISNLRSEWRDRQVEFHKKTVREMALAIIRITAELGACTDAALRGAKFTNEQIERLSAAAVEDADRIAGNGPFSVIAAAKPNEE